MFKLSDDKIEQIINLRLEGNTINDIVLLTNQSKGTISNYLNQYNIGGIVNNFIVKSKEIDKKYIIQYLFNFYNRNLKKEFDIPTEILRTIENIHLQYQKKITKYKIISEKDKLYLQQRYEELGSIKKLVKETGISYEKLRSFIKLKKVVSKYKSSYDIIKNRRFRIKEQLIEYKGGKCEICGYDNCHAALDFHHLDPSSKEFAISNSYCKSLDVLKKEVDKCILVCANHHREIHDGIIDLTNWAVSPHPDKVLKV